LQAKKGDFRGLNDRLFTLENVTNVTLLGYGAIWRMHRADYASAPYKKGEWRHSLSLHAASHVTIKGLTLLESGGDGIYVGSSGGCGKLGNPSTDIVIADVVCDRHYRQGISVITAKRLLIDHCIMRNTFGTAPAAGIDFEPNVKGEVLSDCVMRDCLCENNQGNGIEFYIGQIDGDGEKVSVSVENCISRTSACGLQLIMSASTKALQGEIRFSNCRFERARQCVAKIENKPAEGFGLVFDRCKFLDCGTQVDSIPGTTDFEFRTRRWQDPVLQGVSFNDCTLRQPYPHDWIARDFLFVAERPDAVAGTLKLVTPSGTEDLRLDAAWREAYFPKLAKAPVPPQRTFDVTLAKPVDKRPGEMVSLTPINVRTKVAYRFYAAEAGEVRFTGSLRVWGRGSRPKSAIRVVDEQNATVATVAYPESRESAFSVTVPAAGFYRLQGEMPGCSMSLLKSDVPVAIEAGNFVNLIVSLGTMYVRVPERTHLALAFSGDGSELVHPVIRDPDGRMVWERDGIGGWEAYLSEKPVEPGLWSVELKRPTQGRYEDVSMLLFGAPPELFLCADKYW